LAPFEDEGIEFGQRRFVEANLVEVVLVKPNRRMLTLRGHLLIENVLDIVGAVSLVLAGALEGF
jgi:hypothetical protein